jgi:outer membrane protein assembly factor BamA
MLGQLPLLLVLLLSAYLCGQTVSPPRKHSPREMPASAFKLVAIKVTGSKRFAAEDVIAASGLQIGQTASESDFQTAARHLGETGAFSDVAYSYQYAPDGTKLDFEVTDNRQFVPARFDNLVWFSDADLQKAIHARVPLYNGELPIAGRLADQVSNALQGLLIEHDVQAEAEYLRPAKQDGSMEAFLFHAAGPNLLIGKLSLTGADPELLPELQNSARQLHGKEYSRSLIGSLAQKSLLPILLRRGYLKASLSDPRPTVVETTPEETTVDVSFEISPGQAYRLASTAWSGNKLFPSEKLGAMIHLSPGQPADAVQLADDLEVVHNFYGTLGYLTSSVQPVAQMDDAHATVSYRLEVHEGDVYHMGELEIQGLDRQTTARLIEKWKIHGGDPYDSTYAKRFFKESDPLLPEGKWKMSVHESINSDKTVDVTLRIDPVV